PQSPALPAGSDHHTAAHPDHCAGNETPQRSLSPPAPSPETPSATRRTHLPAPTHSPPDTSSRATTRNPARSPPATPPSHESSAEMHENAHSQNPAAAPSRATPPLGPRRRLHWAGE